MLEGWESGGFFKRDARDKGVQHAECVALKAKLLYGLHKDWARSEHRGGSSKRFFPALRHASRVSFRLLRFKSPSA